jgi:hypothetical protein
MHYPVTSQANACSYCMGSAVLISSQIYLYLQLLWCGILDTQPWSKGYLHVRFQSLCNFNNTLKVLDSIGFVIVIINANIKCKNEKLSLQWKGINRKQSTRWQHLSRLKASAFFSLQKKISCYETQRLILGTGTAIWWVTEPHLKILNQKNRAGL